MDRPVIRSQLESEFLARRRAAHRTVFMFGLLIIMIAGAFFATLTL